MEVAVAVGAFATVPLVYSAIRTRMKTTVNCWFCNTDTKVDYAKRNSFVCPSCEQYNGFNEDGGYNRNVPGQKAMSSPMGKGVRYCSTTPSKKSRNHPDLIPERLNSMSMTSAKKSENGLCDECNRNQETIMKKVADFEPLNEDRWSEELEEFRYKLDRIYQLCPRCTLSVHGKLQEDKNKYSYLFKLHHNVRSAIGSTMNRVFKGRHPRKQFFAGGQTCETLHAVTFLTTLVYFLTNLEHLQQDSGVNLINMPTVIQHVLTVAYDWSFFFHIVIMMAHLFAFSNNLCRTTLPDLLLPVILAVSLFTFAAPSDSFSEDIALCRCACASFMTILSAAITFLPRKKLHKKRPNKIISSAFSVASTPMSQCSSQASRNVTLCEEDVRSGVTMSRRFGQSSPSPTSRLNTSSSPTFITTSTTQLRNRKTSPRQVLGQHNEQLFETNSIFSDYGSVSSKTTATQNDRLRWRERATSPEADTTRKMNKENVEAMDWDDSESVSVSMSSRQNGSGAGAFKPSVLQMRLQEQLKQRNREATPSRELAPSVASMSLMGGDGRAPSVASEMTIRSLRAPPPSVFSSYRRGGVNTARSVAPSGFEHFKSPAPTMFGARSMMGSRAGNGNNIFNNHSPTDSYAHTKSGSVFTSISQREENMGVQGMWHSKAMIFMFLLIFVVLILQIVLFYMLFRK